MQVVQAKIQYLLYSGTSIVEKYHEHKIPPALL